MASFNDGDNTLVLIFRSLNVPMEISIRDLTSYNKPGLAASGVPPSHQNAHDAA